MGEAETPDGGIADWWLIDVGNTNIKTVSFRRGRFSEVDIDRIGLHENPQPAFQRFNANAALSCVNPSELPRARRRVESLGGRLRLVLQSDGAIFRSGIVSTDVKSPETTGVDRVLGCLGALAESGDRGVVVVDCGTATTVNVMTADRWFRGGMIMPGLQLLAESLHSGTALLPQISPNATSIVLGKSTQESLETGVSAAFRGGVEQCVQTALAVYRDAEVFLTGGNAAFAETAFPTFRRIDGLTLRGLHWYAVRAVRES